MHALLRAGSPVRWLGPSIDAIVRKIRQVAFVRDTHCGDRPAWRRASSWHQIDRHLQHVTFSSCFGPHFPDEVASNIARMASPERGLLLRSASATFPVGPHRDQCRLVREGVRRVSRPLEARCVATNLMNWAWPLWFGLGKRNRNWSPAAKDVAKWSGHGRAGKRCEPTPLFRQADLLIRRSHPAVISAGQIGQIGCARDTFSEARRSPQWQLAKNRYAPQRLLLQLP